MSQVPSSQLFGLSSQASRSAAARAGPSTTRIEGSDPVDDPIESFSDGQMPQPNARRKSSRKRKQSPVVAKEVGSDQDADGEIDDTIDALEGHSAGQRGNHPPPSKRMRSSRGFQDLDVTRRTNWDNM